MTDFEIDLKRAVETGIYEDWKYNEDGSESPIDSFDTEVAYDAVLEVLKKYDLINKL